MRPDKRVGAMSSLQLVFSDRAANVVGLPPRLLCSPLLLPLFG